ncbi:restriction endonuclease subunit S [Deinococcus petrolearius]|uniref:Restriction endonuclease subunit S n=1 Tax=Deinococcus petrolearius TaxID=1751295 RepID=A0ABW1DJY5_9DEIO
MSAEEREGLPEGWVETTLGVVTDYGRTNKAEPHEIPADAWVLELEDIEKDTSKIINRANFFERDSKSTKNKFYSGDVLYGKLRPYLNKVVIADSDGFCTTEIVPIEQKEYSDSRFVFYWLKHPTFLKYVSTVSHGMNMPRLGTESGQQAPFLLAPLPEQIRIADKLDALLARVEAGRERLERVPKLVKAFRQAVLRAAVSGELTREWRENNPQKRLKFTPQDETKRGRLWGSGIVPELTEEEVASLPSEWHWVKVGALGLSGIPAVQIGPMSMKSNEFEATGHPVLNVGTVQSGFFDHEKLNYLPHKLTSPFKRYIVEKGDILFTRSGTIGRCAVASSSEDGFLMTFHLLRVRVNQEVCLTTYAFYAFQGGHTVKRQIEESAIGATRAGFNTSLLEGLDIPLPPLPEQAEIVRRVEALFALADRLEARYQSALASFNRLTPALLAKAFRGELVPQDSNDEPASVLLERIRAQRAAEESKPKRGRSVAPGSVEEPKRRGRPPKAQAEAGEQVPSAEAAAQALDLQPPRRRGRPPKVRPEAQAQAPTAIPEASSYEDAVRRLEALKLERAGGTRQVGLFDMEPAEG